LIHTGGLAQDQPLQKTVTFVKSTTYNKKTPD